MLRLFFISIIFQALSSLALIWLELAGCPRNQNLTYVRMRPAAITLKYSVTNTQNNIQRTIHTHILHIYQRKSAIHLTSVGLTHARPN